MWPGSKGLRFTRQNEYFVVWKTWMLCQCAELEGGKLLGKEDSIVAEGVESIGRTCCVTT